MCVIADICERFNSLVKMYYRDVQCGIVVFDVTNPRALARLSIWLQPLHDGAVEHAVFLLIANKIDGERKVGGYLKRYRGAQV